MYKKITEPKSFLIILESLIVIWYIFFSHFEIFTFTQYSAVLKLFILTVIPLVVIFINISKIGISINKIDIISLFFLAILFVGSLFSPVLSTGLFAFFKFLSLFLVFMFFNKSRNWELYAINLIYVFSLIYVLLTISHFLFPSFINTLNSIVLTKEQNIVNNQLFQYGYYAGIAGQTGFNASVIVIFISIAFSKVTTYKQQKLINSFALIVGIIALFLTAKRGPLVGIIIAGIIVLSFMFIFKNKGNISALIKSFISFFMLGSLIYIVAIYIPAIKVVFERFNQGESFFSNRDQIYKNMLFNINDFWIFGNGTSSLSHILDVSGHNVYLQILYENGIIGLFIILLFCGKILLDTLKLILNINEAHSSLQLKMIATASFFFQVSFLVYGTTESVLFNPTMFLPYLIMSATIYSLSKSIKYK